MTIKKIYAVRDSKSETYTAPMLFATKGEAVRNFTEQTNSSESMLSAHPNDFCLFELGEYDLTTAEILPHPSPISVGLAADFKTVPLPEVA